MNIIIKSIRQMVRTPMRTFLFLLLLTLASALLALGAGLYLLSVENTKRLEAVFVTIGTVQQQPTAIHPREMWDAEKRIIVSRGQIPEYGPVIPVESLYFPGANYIIPPVRRPYYGAYNKDWTVHKLDWSVSYIAQMRSDLPVLELEPVEDCIPDHPVEMKIKKILYGIEKELGGWETLWFCDHCNPNPQPLIAGKTYVMALGYKKEHKGVARFTGEYFPNSYYDNLRENRSLTLKGHLPITSTQYIASGTLMQDPFPMSTPWDEVTEGFYETPRGRRWLEFAQAMYDSEQTIPVVPTERTNLLMSFYNGNSSIIAGRDITEEEYKEGQRVCLISQDFAKLNGFSPGNSITLPLYYADYKDSAGKDFSPNDQLLGVFEQLLNAQGKRYSIFEEHEYTIVGVYNEINKVTRSLGYDMSANAVVIPAASVQNSDGNNILDYGPMMGYNTVFQIPNGSIEQFQAAWEKQGIQDLEIVFYDRGYTKIKKGLDQIKQMALALFLSGIFITTMILLFFCQLFIGKQKKRTTIERSLGMSKGNCILSLLSGIIVIALAGSIIGSSMGYFLTAKAMNRFAGRIQEQTFSTAYSNWTDSSVSDLSLQLDSSAVDPYAYFLTGGFNVALAAGISLIGIHRNLKYEPLKLLSMLDA